MTRYHVVFEPEVEAQLRALEVYIAAEGSPEAGERYVTAIVAHCLKLDEFPFRGTPRDDIRAGMRTFVFRRRTLITYMVEDDRVRIIGMAYGGRDLASVLTGSG